MSASQLNIAQLDKVRERRIRELERELGCQIVALKPETQTVPLTEEQAQRLSGMERELGVTLVAYEPTLKVRQATPPEGALKQMRALEKKLGYILVAYELAPQQAAAVPEYSAPPAELTDKQFERLQKAEEEVGLTLMAYKSAQEGRTQHKTGGASGTTLPSTTPKKNKNS